MATNTWSDGKGHSGTVTVTEKSVNYANNTSVVTASFSYSVTSSAGNFDTYSAGGSYCSLTSNGNIWAAPTGAQYPSTGQYAGYYPFTQSFVSNDYTVAHGVDGTGSATITGRFVTATQTSYTPNLGDTAATQALTNIARVPAAPTASVTRSGTGATITVTSTIAADAGGSPTPPAITDYQYRWSTDNATWQTAVSIGTGRTGTFGPSSPTTVSPTQVYYFQTRAYNGETGTGNGISDPGYGAWSTSAAAYAAPFITNISRVGTDVTVTVAPAASNGGSTITGHVVEYSIDQSTWSGAQTIAGATGGSTTFTNLPPGKTYYVRAYATNQASINSPYQTYLGSPVTATVASIFVSAYGRRYFTSGSITNVTTNTKTKTITRVFGNEFVTRFTTSTPHGFVAGENVIVSGIAAPYEYLNGVKNNIAVDSSTEFSTDANNDGLGTITLSGTATVTGTEVTYTTSNSFTAGDTVTITGVTPSQYNLANATLKSATSTQFVITNSATGSFTTPATGTASGWALVLSGKRVDAVSGNITNVTTSGGDITYTASNSFSVGDNVTISGVTPTAFNLVNATIKSATSTQFVITNAATGTYSSSTGKAGRFVIMQTVKKYTAGSWTSFS